MKRIVTAMILGLLWAGLHATPVTITVVDSLDNTPVIGATAFSASGVIAGNTGIDGRLNVDTSHFPLTLRSIGYRQTTADAPADTLRLPVVTYQLGEVTVDPAARPVTRMLLYGREFCTGATPTDTIRIYNEYMLEAFLADDNVKGYKDTHASPRICNIRRTILFTSSTGADSLANPGPDDNELFSLMQKLVEIPGKSVTTPEAMQHGADIHTIQGKYYPWRTYRRTKGAFTVTTDMLADKKGHRFAPWFFKLLGLSMEMNSFQSTVAYAPNDAGIYRNHDITCATFFTHILGTGRWIKKAFKTKEPVDLDFSLEVYPVETTTLSIDDYKAMQKAGPEPTPFTVPESAERLPAAFNRMTTKSTAR